MFDAASIFIGFLIGFLTSWILFLMLLWSGGYGKD